MIANKIIPSFYILSLDGEAANLEFLLGKDFGIQQVHVGSGDFRADIDATMAGQTALDFFLDNPLLDLESVKEDCYCNPEFYPSLAPLEISKEQLATSAELQSLAEEQANPNQIPVVLTCHFDPIGDFVTTRIERVGSNFSAKLKVAISPDRYLYEKGKDKEEQLTQVLGAHREHQPRSMVH